MGRIKQVATALALTGAIVATSACSRQAEVGKDPESYSIVMDSTKKKDDTCVLFNVGSYNTKGISGFKKVKKSNNKGITSGIIINTFADSKGEILKDAEYAKYMVENLRIDYPVYLDVNNMFQNPGLRVDEILALISSFCTKLTANNIFVGISGTEKNIKALDDNDKDGILVAYDVLVTDDDPEITLSGDIQSKITLDSEGKLTTAENIKKTIESFGLNNKDGFVNDLLYKLQPDESLSDVAYKYGLSEEDLLKYNGLSAKEAKKVDKIRIPTAYAGYVTVAQEEPGLRDKPLIGVDISRHQGTVDWQLLKQNADFVIIRASIGAKMDSRWKVNSVNCAESKILLGAYCYNDYIHEVSEEGMDDFKSQIENQTQVFLDAVQGTKMNTPAYLDVEDKYTSSGDVIPLTLNSEQVTFMLDNWYDRMTEQGYAPGLYCSQAMYDYLQQRYKGEQLKDKFNIWIAGDVPYFKKEGIQYKGKPAPIEKVEDAALNLQPDDLSNPKYPAYGNADILQFTERGTGFGAGNDDGYVDVDITFLDLEVMFAEQAELITPEDAELLKTMEPKQIKRIWHEAFGNFSISAFIEGFGGAAVIFTLLELIKRKRSKEQYDESELKSGR